jgi:hypothetical protein
LFVFCSVHFPSLPFFFFVLPVYRFVNLCVIQLVLLFALVFLPLTLGRLLCWMFGVSPLGLATVALRLLSSIRAVGVNGAAGIANVVSTAAAAVPPSVLMSSNQSADILMMANTSSVLINQTVTSTTGAVSVGLLDQVMDFLRAPFSSWSRFGIHQI